MVRDQGDTTHASNLRTLDGIDTLPSDTSMRERLDEVNPRDLRRCFTNIFAQLQRGKLFEQYTVLDGHLAMALDGTGTFSSHSIHCDHCCVKKHQDGSQADPTLTKYSFLRRKSDDLSPNAVKTREFMVTLQVGATNATV